VTTYTRDRPPQIGSILIGGPNEEMSEASQPLNRRSSEATPAVTPGTVMAFLQRCRPGGDFALLRRVEKKAGRPGAAANKRLEAEGIKHTYSRK